MRLNMHAKTTILLIATVALTVACSGGGGAESAGNAPASAPRDDARTLPIPGSSGDSGDLPSGHPPIDGSGGIAPAPSSAGSGALTWTVPDGWIQEQPRSNMRWAQYKVTGADGDGELIVFYFGPGQGGDPASNATRWAGQFAQPDGRSSTDVMKWEKIADEPFATHIVEVTGTYDGGMSGPVNAENYMLLGGIVEGPDAPWFFKFIGPISTVEANRAPFLQMMESIRKDG